MYLTYEDYAEMGGELDLTEFNIYERRAEAAINSQAAGMTGKRLKKLEEIPECVKYCIFDLIQFLVQNADYSRQAASESQSSGSVSESISYGNSRLPEDISESQSDMIYTAFFGGGIGDLLYRGFYEDE